MGVVSERTVSTTAFAALAAYGPYHASLDYYRAIPEWIAGFATMHATSSTAVAGANGGPSPSRHGSVNGGARSVANGNGSAATLTLQPSAPPPIKQLSEVRSSGALPLSRPAGRRTTIGRLAAWPG